MEAFMFRLFASFFFLVALAPGQPVSELDFTGAIGELRDLPQATTQALIAEGNRYLAKRPTFASPAELRARGARVRAQILAAIGGLPAKTPLNARTVATLDRGRYRIEKVVFESQPGFYVTANLYIPNSAGPNSAGPNSAGPNSAGPNGAGGPYPAILFPLGHESGAKAHEAWQYVLGSFATKGFVALAWDPVGQGERYQFWDTDTRASKLVQSTTEHTMLGIQALLVGDHMARYMIHDGIRALDYLVSRPEVDASRVGVTGNSGGGMMTAYLAAIDDRLQVAAPSCYITSWRSLLTQLGPQDAEQNLPPWLSAGLDFPDLIYAFGLKPYLVLSAIRDFFPIGGARSTVAEAKRVYDQFGEGQKIRMVDADDGHGYTKPRRLAAYAWFSRWLANREDDGTEPAIALLSEEELWCTRTGQVLTSLGGESVHSLNLARARALRRPGLSAAGVVAKVRELTRYTPNPRPPAVAAYGVLPRSGYRVEKLTYESEPGIQIPAVLAIPEKPRAEAPAVLLANCAGKSASGERVDALARAGSMVLAIDIRGCGELTIRGPRGPNPWYDDYRNTTAALLLGRTMVGLRVLDITAGIDLLNARTGLGVSQVKAMGIGAAAAPMLFAAALDQRIAEVELDGLLQSYQSVVESRLHRGVYEHVLPGVLQHVEIADVVRAIAPRAVVVRRYVDALGQPVKP
jgi:cephalosporin-C deacetylase-like acetyl esterase